MNNDEMEIDPIKPQYFYSNEAEKIKLNWFCYEYAFVLYKNLRESKKLKKYRKENTKENIVQFCVYLSKEMKNSIHQKLGGITEEIVFYEEYVEEYYPKNTRAENYLLLTEATKAWEEMLSDCVTCPTRCISEMNEKCILFDELDEDGYLGGFSKVLKAFTKGLP
jgi:hypothetical protein